MVAEYLKGIKYRDQEDNFKEADGEVLENMDFTGDQCAEIMCLWYYLTEKRAREIPDESMFIQSSGGSKGDPSPLFLCAEGKTITSCVLFRLRKTITSDLQGFDYVITQPLKSYFTR
jgi:hypothetical protein